MRVLEPIAAHTEEEERQLCSPQYECPWTSLMNRFSLHTHTHIHTLAKYSQEVHSHVKIVLHAVLFARFLPQTPVSYWVGPMTIYYNIISDTFTIRRRGRQPVRACVCVRPKGQCLKLIIFVHEWAHFAPDCPGYYIIWMWSCDEKVVEVAVMVWCGVVKVISFSQKSAGQLAEWWKSKVFNCE